MTCVAVSTLLLVALVAAVAAFVLTDAFLGSMPPVGWAWVTLASKRLSRLPSAWGVIANSPFSIAAIQLPLPV